MKCKNCGSNNISIQLINEVKFKNKHRGILYWLIIGWWLEIVMWFCFTFIRLLILIFIPKRQKTINKTIKKAICQDCGCQWTIK